MNQKAFKDAYTAAFLGAYAALRYDENCQKCWPDDTQPVGDAEILADTAWKQLEEE